MQHRRTRHRWLWLLVPGLILTHVATSVGLVDPQLQPSHLIKRHRAVVGFTASDVDYDKGLVTLQATKVCFGQFAPKQVTIEVPEVDFDEDSLLDEVKKGDTVVAFVGKLRRRHEQDVLLYAGSQWHDVRMIGPQQPEKCEWLKALGDETVGTFNGDGMIDVYACHEQGNRAYLKNRAAYVCRSHDRVGARWHQEQELLAGRCERRRPCRSAGHHS